MKINQKKYEKILKEKIIAKLLRNVFYRIVYDETIIQST